MNDEPTGTYECPVCCLDSPHHHADPTRDARVAVLAHVIAGTYLGYHGMDKHGCRHAFQTMDRGVRREMWAVADRTLSELEATLRTRAEQAERQRDNASDAFRRSEAELAETRRQLAAVRVSDVGDFWAWQGAGDDPASLTCPVVMTADTLRATISRAEAAEAEVARLRGQRESALREAAGVCDRSADCWEGTEFYFALGPAAQAERRKVAGALRTAGTTILALLDAPAAEVEP